MSDVKFKSMLYTVNIKSGQNNTNAHVKGYTRSDSLDCRMRTDESCESKKVNTAHVLAHAPNKYTWYGYSRTGKARAVPERAHHGPTNRKMWP